MMEGSIEGEEDRHQDRTLRDAKGNFDKTGVCVADSFEPFVQIGHKPSKGSIVDSKRVL